MRGGGPSLFPPARAVLRLCLGVYNQCQHQKDLKDDLEDIAEFARRVGVSVSKEGTTLDWTALQEKLKEVSQLVQKITSRGRLWAFLYAKADRDEIEDIDEAAKERSHTDRQCHRMSAKHKCPRNMPSECQRMSANVSAPDVTECP